MARASILAENNGIPAVGILCKGFPVMVKQIAKSAGLPDLRMVEYPAPIALDDAEVVRKNIKEVVVPGLIKALTKPVKSTVKNKKRGPSDRDIVFEGTYEEIQEYFYEKRWSDGLPIVPPTVEKVEEFLKYTDRDPEEVLGVLEPAMGTLNVWKVAVNGVMAGCKPEYMPILVAIGEILGTPEFSVKDSGATPGWEALIMLNGPIRDVLDFNYKAGFLRPDRMPNVSIGRFYRLILRNVAGSLVGSTDMSTHGQMFRAVAPENDQVCEEIGWPTLAEKYGFDKNDSVVTIVSGRACSDPVQTNGETAERQLDYIVDWVERMIEPYQAMRKYQENHVLFLSPVVAKLLAELGYDKNKIEKYIHDHAKCTAEYFEMNSSRFNNWKPYSLKEAVEKGDLGPEWYESDDPKRMVPLLGPGTKIEVVICGDMTRNRNMFIRSNYTQGRLTSKKVELPENWADLVKNR